MPIAKLDRTILRICGKTAKAFLERLITNTLKDDITFSALLTPQGKIIADFFVHRCNENEFFIETPEKFGGILSSKLKFYKLRDPVEIKDVTDMYSVYVLWGGEGEEGVADPRHQALGYRLLTTEMVETENTAGDYDIHRLTFGILDSNWDFESQDFFPADTCMDVLNGVNYKKGCFIGQEVVSRMHRKTNVQKRVLGLKMEAKVTPESGMKIFQNDREIGRVLHANGHLGTGFIRLNRMSGSQGITVNHAPVEIMELPNQ